MLRKNIHTGCMALAALSLVAWSPGEAQEKRTRAASGDTLQLAPDHPQQYVVKKGDTLWDISGKFLVRPWRWPELWSINPQIENPDLIYPGDTVHLVYEGNVPRLTLKRGDVDTAAARVSPTAGGTGTSRAAGGRTVKLTPRVRTHSRDAIAALPLEHIQQFLEFPILVDVEEFELKPYVIDVGTRNSIRAGSLRDRVYVRGELAPGVNAYTVFSMQSVHKDPEDPEGTLFYEAVYAGEVRIIERGDPAVAVITKSQREIGQGDRLYPSSEVNRGDPSRLNIIPHAPYEEVEGRILSVVGGNIQIAEYQVLLIDLGEEDGVDPGTVLSLTASGWQTEDPYHSRQRALQGDKEGRISFEYEDESPVDSILASFANDLHGLYRRFQELRLDRVAGVPITALPQQVQIPGATVGTVMVFRSFPKHSYVLVMGLTDPALVADHVRSPR